MKTGVNKMEKAAADERGIALITAVFAILLATVIGFALYYSSTIAFTIAINDRDNTEAFYLADAGINHANALFDKIPKSEYSNVLKAGADNAPDSGDELSQPPTSGLWAGSDSIPAGSATGGGGVTNFGAGGVGRYWVRIKNDAATGETPTIDANGILIITSIGVGRDGSTATIEEVVSYKPPFPAILINGKAKVSGSIKIEGTNGIFHSNDTLILSGNPCTEQYFSSSTTIQNPTNLKGGVNCNGTGVTRPNQPYIDPPIYNIRNDFFGKTDYTLGAVGTRAGKVYNNLGVMIADTARSGGNWTSGTSTWTWDSSNMAWIQSGSSIQNGSFYSEGNIAITGNFGTKTIPSIVTFIAEGCIYNEGKQYIKPAYNGFSLVAGTDLKIKGKLSTGLDDLEAGGLIYAHHQIDFAGTPTFTGTVVAANQADTNSPGGFNLVPLDGGYMNLNGNPTVISNSTGGGGGINAINWREVRQ